MLRLLVSGLLLSVSGAALAAEEITVVSGGGILQDAHREAFWKPTAEKLGIKINEATTAAGLQDVRVQVQSGAVTWDLVDMGSNECAIAASEGLLEPLDYSVINTDGIDPAVVAKDWVGIFYFSTVMAWNSETVSGKPANWADFFDTEKYPGDRGVYNYPLGTLEIALLADGADPKALYPLDVERAFKKLEQLKPSISVWWDSGAQSAQLAKDGAIDLLQVWNGRINGALKDGAKFDYTFNQGILQADCYAIPKGAPNKDLAMKALAEFVSPEPQANFTKYISYGPVNAKAFETGIITPEGASKINSSPENAKSQIIADSVWWGENGAKIMELWDNFRQK